MMTPKMMLDKNKDKIPKVGDRYVVTGVYPGTTDDLWRPRIEVTLEPEQDEKAEPVLDKKGL